MVDSAATLSSRRAAPQLATASRTLASSPRAMRTSRSLGAPTLALWSAVDDGLALAGRKAFAASARTPNTEAATTRTATPNCLQAARITHPAPAQTKPRGLGLPTRPRKRDWSTIPRPRKGATWVCDIWWEEALPALSGVADGAAQSGAGSLLASGPRPRESFACEVPSRYQLMLPSCRSAA